MLNDVLIATLPTGYSAPAVATADLTSVDDLADLYDRYGALAFSLAHHIVRDRGVAEDVVQEAFLALWKNADRYDASRASMRTWLCRIVRNRAIDRLRGTSARQRNDASLDMLTSLSSSTDVVSDVLRGEEAAAITTALTGLPRAQREVIELAYYGGYTQTEIAARTQQPLGTVKGRTRLAMRALAVALAPLYSPNPGTTTPERLSVRESVTTTEVVGGAPATPYNRTPMQVAPTTEELLEIHGRIRACVACRLHVTRTQAVPGYGPVEARIMAVGEAPGEKEDQQGRPFVGAAGKLLTELVESIGLTRRDLYITNTVRCRPPGNRDPEPDEVQACSHFLDEQIALMRPDVILVLGRHALSRLLPELAGNQSPSRPACAA